MYNVAVRTANSLTGKFPSLSAEKSTGGWRVFIKQFIRPMVIIHGSDFYHLYRFWKGFLVQREVSAILTERFTVPRQTFVLLATGIPIYCTINR